MTDTKIKICGVTTTEDAKLADGLGVDYIGLIFTHSPRRIDVARAKEIRQAVPHRPIVGVFQDQSVDEVVETVEQAAVDLIQLHGDESPAYCAELQLRAGRNIIKAFCADDIPDAERLGSYQTTGFFLFDLAKRDLENDEVTGALDAMWADVSRTRRQGFRVFVAGALDPENVRDAIASTHAFCVDVCRGVETSPGVKDPDALERFVSEVRS